jgi:hypothetical protein
MLAHRGGVTDFTHAQTSHSRTDVLLTHRRHTHAQTSLHEFYAHIQTPLHSCHHPCNLVSEHNHTCHIQPLHAARPADVEVPGAHVITDPEELLLLGRGHPVVRGVSCLIHNPLTWAHTRIHASHTCSQTHKHKVTHGEINADTDIGRPRRARTHTHKHTHTHKRKREFLFTLNSSSV